VVGRRLDKPKATIANTANNSEAQTTNLAPVARSASIRPCS
jgi:hypothetical protein